jgi:hypothetical protein
VLVLAGLREKRFAQADMKTGRNIRDQESRDDMAKVAVLGKLLGNLGIELESAFEVGILDMEVGAIIPDRHIERDWKMGREAAVIENHLRPGMDDRPGIDFGGDASNNDDDRTDRENSAGVCANCQI